MDFLKAAIADTKQSISKRRAPTKGWKKDDSDSSDSDDELVNKKYLKRGELKRLAEKEKEKEGRAAKKQKRDKKDALEEIARKIQEDADAEASSFAKDSANKASSKEMSEMLPPNEVKILLREHGLPITLFGESDLERFRRFKQHEFELEEKQGGQAGYANAFHDIIQQEVERDIQDATAASIEGEKSEEQKNRELAKRARLMAKKHNKYANARPRTDFETVEEYLIFFFKRMLSLWELELDQRSADEKKTTKGKVASATQKQTRQYLQPFFKQLKKKEAPPDVVVRVTKIVDECCRREYVFANEAYLTMAIGNAAWPMGVTMVGIHERAGREKIFSQNQAHVLNNETSRKYIQAIKRIMTFCQHAYPNVPSKMVI